MSYILLLSYLLPIFNLALSLLQDHPSVIEDLDLVEEDDQFTHMLTLEDATSVEDILSMAL